jgi:hypothetical protein
MDAMACGKRDGGATASVAALLPGQRLETSVPFVSPRDLAIEAGIFIT